MVVPVRLLTAFLLLGATAVSLPDLFHKSKEQFQLGAYADALSTLETLDRASRQTGMEKDRAALLPGLLFYRGASLAALGRADEAEAAFQEFLAYQPNAQLDPARYPAAVVAALDRARHSISRTPASDIGDASLAAAYAAFPRPGGADAENPTEDWLEGPVKFLLSTDEKREFSRLADPVSRSEFVATFWKSHDPRPETPANELRDEFAKRVAFADAHFAQDEVRGSLTDRGMAFVLLGPPTYSGRKPLRTGDDVADASGLSRYGRAEITAAGKGGPSNTDRMARIDKVTGPGTKVEDAASNWIEVWHYLRRNLPPEIPFQELELEFVTKAGYGKNVLQRETKALTALDRARLAARRGATSS
jgi:GWxTD domain-containing protein